MKMAKFHHKHTTISQFIVIEWRGEAVKRYNIRTQRSAMFIV